METETSSELNRNRRLLEEIRFLRNSVVEQIQQTLMLKKALPIKLDENTRELVLIPNSEKVHVNEQGGKQSDIGVRTDLLPVSALLDISKVLAMGRNKYGPFNWHKITVEEHLNHAIRHCFKYLEEATYKVGEVYTLEELSHAGCRILFALEMAKNGNFHPDFSLDKPATETPKMARPVSGNGPTRK